MNDVLTSKPVAHELNLDEQTRYIEIANKIGMSDHPIVVDVKLKSLLVEEHIRVYDLQQVENYLDKVFPAIAWVWSPLRSSDLYYEDHYISKNWHRNYGTNSSSFFRNWGNNYEIAGRIGFSIYTKPIPLPVLLTIEKNSF